MKREGFFVQVKQGGAAESGLYFDRRDAALFPSEVEGEAIAGAQAFDSAGGPRFRQGWQQIEQYHAFGSALVALQEQFNHAVREAIAVTTR